MELEVLVTGTDRKGETVFDRTSLIIAGNTLGNYIADLHHEHPEAIHFEVHIAYPDPEYIRMKNTLRSLLVSQKNKSVEELMGHILNYFDVHLREE